MSQIRFNAKFDGKDVQVSTGWDRPLQYYHLTIFDMNPNAEDDVVWSCLDHFGFCKSLDIIKDQLKKMNIECPEGTFDLIARKEGNVFYAWRDGKWNRSGV